MSNHSPHNFSRCTTGIVHHHMVCQHQIEVTVWPATAEVYFKDERYVNIINTQTRFKAVVYNALTDRVSWSVVGLDGLPGAGHIDQTGLYTAPPKGSFSHGLTDVIIATSVDDPFRKACGYVSLVGLGPLPAPTPEIEIFPKQAFLYYQSGKHNSYMDTSNKIQLFRATLRNSTSAEEIEWLENDTLVGTGFNPWYLYSAPTLSGAYVKVITISARIKNKPNIQDEAKVKLLDYKWPGVVPIVNPPPIP